MQIGVLPNAHSTSDGGPQGNEPTAVSFSLQCLFYDEAVERNGSCDAWSHSMVS